MAPDSWIWASPVVYREHETVGPQEIALGTWVAAHMVLRKARRAQDGPVT